MRGHRGSWTESSPAPHTRATRLPPPLTPQGGVCFALLSCFFRIRLLMPGLCPVRFGKRDLTAEGEATGALCYIRDVAPSSGQTLVLGGCGLGSPWKPPLL